MASIITKLTPHDIVWAEYKLFSFNNLGSNIASPSELDIGNT